MEQILKNKFFRLTILVIYIVLCIYISKDFVLTTLLPHYETEAMLVEKIPYVANDVSGNKFIFKYSIKGKSYFDEIDINNSFDIKLHVGNFVKINVLEINHDITFIKIWYNYYFMILTLVIITTVFLVFYYKFD